VTRQKLKEKDSLVNPITAYAIKNFPTQNLNARCGTSYDKVILLHSESRSYNLEKYQSDRYIPAYYWNHALLSLDWFRYAQYVNFDRCTKKLFLIYNRAWSGTREYRLRFAELVLGLGLEKDCKTSINPIEPELGIHYNVHKFNNPVWRPQTVLENFFPISNAHSHYSADFDIKDYETTDIEVVLETLFDDSRLQLTEKSLRPIACAQPFILAGTHGSLGYLRSYGFRTFGHIWDERYDTIEDPEERLYAIGDLMKQIANWLPHQRETKMAQAREIAEYNRQHFFSTEFEQHVHNELITNLKSALNKLKQSIDWQKFVESWQNVLLQPELKKILAEIPAGANIPNLHDIELLLSKNLNKS
jgi:hypothetical protein